MPFPRPARKRGGDGVSSRTSEGSCSARSLHPWCGSWTCCVGSHFAHSPLADSSSLRREHVMIKSKFFDTPMESDEESMSRIGAECVL